jgi:hypothetical protein
LIFRIGGSCICVAGILLARETDDKSLVLLLVSGPIFALTAIFWATNGYASWDRLMAWDATTRC